MKRLIVCPACGGKRVIGDGDGCQHCMGKGLVDRSLELFDVPVEYKEVIYEHGDTPAGDQLRG